jgi:peptidoglycan/LPS O-acetylase OafA/YrhL
LPARRIPELDGIRGLAILSVLYWHFVACPTAHVERATLGGLLHRIGLLSWSGVDLFFVLSGFLIGGILFETRDEPLYFQNFYVRRIFRILPLYLVMWGGGVLLLTLFPGLTSILGTPMPLPAYAAFLQNFWLACNSWEVYLGATWSLAVEEQFYFVFPFVVRLARKRSLPILLAGLALASAVARTVLYLSYGRVWGTSAYTLVICRADSLMLGALGAWAVRDARARAWLENRLSLLRGTALVFGAVAVLMLLEGWSISSLPMSTVGYTCLALLYLSLVLLAVLHTSGRWAAIVRFGPLRSLGRIAYCVYLVHEPAFRLCAYWLQGTSHPEQLHWATAGAALVVSLAVAQLSWRFFESKMIRIGHRLSGGALLSERPAPVELA